MKKQKTTPYVTDFVRDGVTENPLPHLKYVTKTWNSESGTKFILSQGLQQKWIIQKFENGYCVESKEEWRDVPTETIETGYGRNSN